ncbi:hypothetical protein, partial [Duodenibacillus massiliensis]|uniref:hypothetical protein n=1 Tax=Duodenibacillus massiliensis TaxID=1852381 RepID=UPI00307CBE1F
RNRRLSALKTNAMGTARKRFSIVHSGAVGHLVEKARKTHVDALGRHKRDDSEKSSASHTQN